MSSLDFSSLGLKNASASFRHKMRALFCIIIFTIGRSFVGMSHTSLLSSFGSPVRFAFNCRLVLPEPRPSTASRSRALASLRGMVPRIIAHVSQGNSDSPLTECAEAVRIAYEALQVPTPSDFSPSNSPTVCTCCANSQSHGGTQTWLCCLFCKKACLQAP